MALVGVEVVDLLTPECTLDVCEASWVGAGGSWVDNGITLEVDVEGLAAVCGIAELLALDGVVGLEDGVAEIFLSIDGSSVATESKVVANYARSATGWFDL